VEPDADINEIESMLADAAGFSESKTVYKFDASGDKLKTCATFEEDGAKAQYFTDGDAAVCVTDEGTYGGTVEQFELTQANGVDALIKDTFGDSSTIFDCATKVTQDTAEGYTTYEITLDPDKYTVADETIQFLIDPDSPLTEAVASYVVDADGHIVSMGATLAFTDSTIIKTMNFSGFDSTTVDPMPKADKTFEEMEADVQAELDALYDELDAAAAEFEAEEQE
jgi:hypothetical protein